MILPSCSFPDLHLSKPAVHKGRHVPCWEAAGAIYHIACHLADSVPAAELRAWQEARHELTALVQRDSRELKLDEIEWLKTVYNARVEKFLASGYGECLLKTSEAQQCVRDVLTHDNGVKYALHAWCVMPNHLHVIVGGLTPRVSLRGVLGDWKRISSHGINRQLGRKGPVWGEDTYTRIIRDADEYLNQLKYVWHNPESAGLKAGFAREAYVPFA